MPYYCCVRNCPEQGGFKGSKVTLFNFPRNATKRHAWLSAVSIQSDTPQEGKPSNDPMDPDYAPTLLLGNEEVPPVGKARRRKNRRDPVSQIYVKSDPSIQSEAGVSSFSASDMEYDANYTGQESGDAEPQKDLFDVKAVIGVVKTEEPHEEEVSPPEKRQKKIKIRIGALMGKKRIQEDDIKKEEGSESTETQKKKRKYSVVRSSAILMKKKRAIAAYKGIPKKGKCVFCKKFSSNIRGHLPSCALITVPLVLVRNELGKHGRMKEMFPQMNKAYLARCDTCKKVFVHASLLARHKCSRVIYPKKDSKETCELCMESFPLKSSLKLHQFLTHLRGLRYASNYCSAMHRWHQCRRGRICYRAWKEQFSARIMPNVPRLLRAKSSCWLADEPIKRGRNIQQHQNYKVKHTCRVCLKFAVNIRMHMMNYHQIMTEGLIHCCMKCFKAFPHRHALALHQQTVHDKLPGWLCSKCGKSFASESGYYTHMRVHDRWVFTCRHCNRTFSRLKSRCIHEKEAHTEIQKVSCQWEGCHKQFKRAYGLKVHMRMHTGEKPYRCFICEFTCAQKSSLNHHTLKVHGVDITHRTNPL